MPELPEVETTRRGIEPHVLGARIRATVVRDARLRFGVDPALPSHLQDRQVVATSRRSKYLVLSLDSGADLVLHLGMSGRLRVLLESTPPGPHDHFDLELTNDRTIRLTDPRRFGSVLWAPAGFAEHPRARGLGPEPLTASFDGAYLWAACRGRRVAIKQLLMDAAVVVGVGNIYANEALFMAGIRPSTTAHRVSKERAELLSAAVKAVLEKAIAAGGTTFRDFFGSDGRPGYFVQELQVYGREGEPCRNCGGLLRSSRLGGRATVHCLQCQRR